jgi:pimeloyl-ACP methyl ester carboxylesterase
MRIGTIAFLVASLAVILLFIRLVQKRLIYYPDRYSGQHLLMEAQRKRVTPWPSLSSYHGLLAEPQTAVNGTVMIAHGNAGSALDRTFYLRPLIELGYRVILLEYPGYGPREGVPNEKNIVSEVRASLQMARSQFGSPIYLVGESLGSGVAAEVAGLSQDLADGLVLITPWDDLPSVAQAIYWFLPVKILMTERYNSIRNLKDFQKRTAVIVAEQDEIIPRKSSDRLYDSLPNQKKRWVIPKATHNSWPGIMDIECWKAVFQFMAGHE